MFLAAERRAVLQIRLGQNGSSESRIRQVGIREICSSKLGVRQGRTPQTRHPEILTSEVPRGQVVCL